MADHQHLQVGQRVGLRQELLGLSGHVAGDEQVEVPGGGQGGEPLLVQIAGGQQGRIDGEDSLAQGDTGGLGDEHHGHAPALRQGHQAVADAVFVLDVRQVECVHRQAGQDLRKAVGVVSVVMGDDHGGQTADAGALQRVGGHRAGVHVGVAAAAVHQRRFAAGAQGHALPLPHVQHGGAERAVPLPVDVEPQAGGQGQHRQGGGQGVLALAVRGDGAADKGGVYIQQPHPEVHVGKVHRVVGYGQQQMGRPEDVFDQQKGHIARDMAQGRPHKAQEGGDEGRHEGVARGGHSQQSGQGRNKGQDVEVIGRQRCGEHQRAQGSGQVGGDEGQHGSDGAVSAAIPGGEALIEPPGQQHHAQRGGKTELQTDAAHGVGVHQQDDRQGGGQAGQRVAAPPEQGRTEQKQLHDTGAGHGGRQAGEQHIEHQHRRGHGAQGAAAGGRDQQGQQGDKEGAVQAGDGEDVGQARLLHGHVVLLRQQGLVAGELGGKEAQHGGVVPQLGQLVPQGFGGVLGRIAQGHILGGLHRQGIPVVQQGVDAAGAELPQVAVADGGHVVPPGRAGELVAGAEGKQVVIAVVDGLRAGKAAEADGDLRAVHRGLRPVADGGGEVVLPAAEGLHRLADEGAVGGEIQKRKRQGQEHQQDAAEVGRSPAQQRPQEGHQGQRPGGVELPAVPGQEGEEQSGGKGEANSGQNAHTLSPPPVVLSEVL